MGALLSGLIDYAGLFPPAGLGMQAAVENYYRYSASEHAGALGRFICPASRLDELTARGASLMPGTYATSGYPEMADDREPWRVSVIIDGPLDACLVRVDAFNEHHADRDHGLAQIDAIEIKIGGSGDIDDALEYIPNDIMPFFEIGTDGDPRGAVAALAGEAAAAKIRCGGVRPGAIPPVEAVAAFINACNAAHVPFKATAGLHHPVRAEQALTYDADPPRAVMHGFVNVFLAAALRSERVIGDGEGAELLAETDAGAFGWTDDSVRWRGRSLDLVALARARERFALSYGSCSFEEPLGDAAALGWV
jgi:hypothetical protein